MSKSVISTLTARAATRLSRRASLIALGGVGFAGLVTSSPAQAGKAGKRAKKACKRQIAQCEGSVNAFCAELPFLEGCEEALIPCCGSFKNCRAREAYDCIFAALAEIAPT